VHILKPILALLLLSCTPAAPPLRAIERGQGDGPVLVLLHGYGSRPEHMESFADRTDLPEGTRCVFPYAPHPIGDGFMWWSLPQQLGDLRRTSFPGMRSARAAISALLDDVQRRHSVRSDRIVLGGFSQGAMLSLDVALHDPRPLAGLVLLSGSLVDEAEWRPRVAARRGLRVYASHGTADRVLPFSEGRAMIELLREGGADVRFREFDGGHVVTPEVASDVAALLREASSP
jgi:phospholipase/carboxylesterase